MLAKSCAVSATHSCGSRAPIGCIALKSGMQAIDAGEVLLDLRDARVGRRRSPRSGGGHGCITSQVIGTRLAGSCASSSCRIVVPVRGRPTMKIGRADLAGARSRDGASSASTMRSRFSSRRTRSRARDHAAERGEVAPRSRRRRRRRPQRRAEARVAEVGEPGRPPRAAASAAGSRRDDAAARAARAARPAPFSSRRPSGRRMASGASDTTVVTPCLVARAPYAARRAAAML